MAQQMHNMAIIRSMSTREADHDRGRYYMHTGFVPNPNVEHPSYGAVLAHELMVSVRNSRFRPSFLSAEPAKVQFPGHGLVTVYLLAAMVELMT